MIKEDNFQSNSDLEDVESQRDIEFESSDNFVVDSEQTQEYFSNLERENTSLRGEVEEFKDKLLRVSAEYTNYRKRTSKEKEEIYSNACLDVITQILPILDNLERATVIDSDIDSLKKGIDMVTKLFNDALYKLGVREIDSSGEFDPNFHEAVMHVDDENFGENSIVEVFQKGYIRNDKVIRHSVVKVAN